MKIMYVPSDMDAPGCYRCLFPARQLAAHGHEVRLPPYEIVDRPDGTWGARFDLKMNPPERADIWVLQQRRERMWAEDGVHTLRAHGITTVADVDDNYLELPEWNPAFYGTHPHIRNDGVIINRATRRKREKRLRTVNNSANRDHMHKMFEMCDALTVSTPYLKELYRNHNPNITVVRNFLDWDIWEDIQPQYEVKRWGDRVRIGYLGVFRYRRGDLEVLRDIIAPFLAKHRYCDFVANSPEVHDFLSVPKRQRVVVKEYGFSPRDGSTYPVGRKTAHLDLGLVPLAPGGINEAKSHLKGMEYNAVGAPFLCSDTESYRYWADGQNGVTCHTPKDWLHNLEELVTDHELRRAMGSVARDKAEKHSIQNNWFEFQDAYEGILGDELTRVSRGAIARGAVQKVSELRFLLETAQATGEIRTVVEVGSARGGTFWAFSQVATEDALLISIDIPSGSPLDVRAGKDVYDGRDRDRLRRFVKPTQKCRLIDADSQQLSTVDMLLDTLGTRPIDLLFIDADHRYPGVKRDYELYSPLVREGGLIGFHDVIRQNDVRSGVHMLWAELRKRQPRTFEYVGKDNWGLGNWGAVGVIIK